MIRTRSTSILLSLAACAAPMTYFDLQESPENDLRSGPLQGSLEVSVRESPRRAIQGAASRPGAYRLLALRSRSLRS